MARPDYLPRLVDPLIEELLSGLPAVLLVGPRASGKTTTARRHAVSVLRLDKPSEASAVAADPDVVLAAHDEPVVIDEWQMAPQVLGAVKRAVDGDPRPGRFILTGSAATDLTTAGWPATGRVVRVRLLGLTVREVAGNTTGEPFLSKLLRNAIDEVRLPREVPDLKGYVELALQGGFPEVVLQASARLRTAWLASYVDHLVSRDVSMPGQRRDPVRLRRYLQAVAANTAGVVDHKTLYDAAGLNRLTAVAYDSVLQSLFVTEHVPAWAAGRLGRLVATPKRYLVDPALLGPLLGVDARSALRDADLLGRVIDSFVVSQLRAELAVCDQRPSLYHLREAHGRREVDVVVEAADGTVAGIEVKAGSTPSLDSARHLVWLRDRLGDRFAAGVVLHSGPHPVRLADRIVALPICAIWG